MIYIWRTGHQINEEVSNALHAGIPGSVLKSTDFVDQYIKSPNRFTAVAYGILRGTESIFKNNGSAGWYEVDRGYIRAKHYDGYYRITRSALQAAYKDHELPSDRLDKLAVQTKSTYHPKGLILVCPPTKHIEGFCGHRHGWWLETIEAFLREHNITYRVRTKGDSRSLEDDLYDCRGVVTFNSNVAVDAAINGIPVITGKHSICGDWSHNNLSALVENTLVQETPEHLDKLLRFISYNQFTLDEIRSGVAWRTIST